MSLYDNRLFRFCLWLISLPSQIWEELKKKFVSLIVTSLIAVPTTLGGYVVGIYYSKEHKTAVFQNDLGVHCVYPIFEKAKEMGGGFQFAPPETQAMMICGAPLPTQENDLQSAVYTYKNRSSCFAADEKEGKIIIRPNLSSGKVYDVSRQGGSQRFTCLCREEIPALIVKYNQEGNWCNDSYPVPKIPETNNKIQSLLKKLQQN
jgi:hypothetical protein